MAKKYVSSGTMTIILYRVQISVVLTLALAQSVTLLATSKTIDPQAFHRQMSSGLSCTSFMAVHNGNVMFGDSEDGSLNHPMIRFARTGMIWFIPGSTNQHGRMHLGWLWQGNSNSYQVGMNEKGLAYSFTAAPEQEMKRHPQRTFSFGKDDYIDRLLYACATVNEVIALTHNFDMETMWFQVFLADASGDAAVISPGPDGELAVTRKSKADMYLAASTFNLADRTRYVGKDSFKRYDDVVEMLEKMKGKINFDVEFFRRGLEIVHRRNDPASGAYTVYSNIFDLTNRIAYIYFFSQFDEVVQFDLTEELDKGKHCFSMTDVFSQKTVNQGIGQLQSVIRRGKIQRCLLFGIVLIAVIALIWQLTRTIIRRTCRKTSNL